MATMSAQPLPFTTTGSEQCSCCKAAKGPPNRIEIAMRYQEGVAESTDKCSSKHAWLNNVLVHRTAEHCGQLSQSLARKLRWSTPPSPRGTGRRLHCPCPDPPLLMHTPAKQHCTQGKTAILPLLVRRRLLSASCRALYIPCMYTVARAGGLWQEP